MDSQERRALKQRFLKARKAEARYRSQLRTLARQIEALIKGFDPTVSNYKVPEIVNALNAYAELLKPWAATVATSMLNDVNQRDFQAWSEHGKYLGTKLRQEVASASVGQESRRMLSEQVELITSLPRKAAERVQGLATGMIYSGERPESLVAEILKTGFVTESRARLIARTEVSRASATFMEARARHVGSEGYIWRTSDDGDVRDSHKKMEGKYVAWGNPPTLDNMRGHAGCLPNCRCWAEPVLPDFKDLQ